MTLDEIKKARSRAAAQLTTHPYKNLVDKFFQIMEIGALQKEAEVRWEAVFFGVGEVYNPWYSGGEFIGQFLNIGDRIGILSSNTSPGFKKYGLLKNESLPSSKDHVAVFKNGSVLKIGAGSLFVLFSPNKNEPPRRSNDVDQANLLNGKLREFLAEIH